MKPISADDIPRIATAVRLAGELLDAHGVTVLDVVRDWQAGVHGAPEGIGGTRWEDCTDPGCVECPNPTSDRSADRLHFHPRANDPTGETAATAAGGSVDTAAAVFTELQHLLVRAFADCSRLNAITAGIVPPDTAVDPVRWCNHHLQIGLCEPRHRGDECRFCYDFRLLWGKLPPLSILGIRHRYGRVTKDQVEAALDADARRNDTRQRIDDKITAARLISKPAKAAATNAPAEPDDDDLAGKLADALGRLVAAQETASPRRIERAWRKYLRAHEAFAAAHTNPPAEQEASHG